jgi:hypothetical protein
MRVTWRIVPPLGVIGVPPITLGEGANHATTLHTQFANMRYRAEEKPARRIHPEFPEQCWRRYLACEIPNARRLRTSRLALPDFGGGQDVRLSPESVDLTEVPGDFANQLVRVDVDDADESATAAAPARPTLALGSLRPRAERSLSPG